MDERAGGGYWLVHERKFQELVFCSSASVLLVLALKLSANSSKLEILDRLARTVVIANEFPKITRRTTQIVPRKDLLSRVANSDTKFKGLVKQESLFVLVLQRVFNVLLFSDKLFLSFLKDLGDYELVVEFGTCAANGNASVFVDELRVAFRRMRANDVELSLLDFDDSFFGRIAREPLSY